MRRSWRRAASAASAAMVAVLMVVVNSIFEAAGSVPDAPECGFLAGSLPSLAVIYPLLAAVVAARVTRLMAHRKPDFAAEAAQGAVRGAAWGAAIYFIAGVSLTAFRAGLAAVPPFVWLAIAGYVALCALGSRIGASMALDRGAEPAWRPHG